MKANGKKLFFTAACLLAAFAVWTVSVSFIDVRPIGPQGSAVGFAALNSFVHNLTGVHMSLYTVTDCAGLVPVVCVLVFAVIGLIQWIRRKSLRAVDPDLLLLGGFYLAVMAVYVLFEIFVVNYRPVLINGILEPSYPSSTTLLIMCVMPTTGMQLRARIKNATLRQCMSVLIAAFTVLMVICRLISGVHWFTDIIGGVLLSTGLVSMYKTAVRTFR